jgi:hypothetical protein
VNSIVLPTKCLQHALAWMCSRSAGFSCMPFVYHIAYWDVRYGSCARVRRSKRSRNQMQEAMDTCSFATRDQGRCFIVRRTLRPDRTHLARCLNVPPPAWLARQIDHGYATRCEPANNTTRKKRFRPLIMTCHARL